MYGTNAKTKAGEKERGKHGISKGSVTNSLPTSDKPHVKGTAFDVIIKDEKGNTLNGLNFTSKKLQDLAVACGLRNDIKNGSVPDGVHFQLP